MKLYSDPNSSRAIAATTNDLWRRPVFQMIGLVMLLAACARPPEPANEGIRGAERPPRFLPARSADALLASRGVSALVVRMRDCCRYGMTRVHVQLFANDGWRDATRTDSTDTTGVVILTDLPPRSYTGLVRRVGLKEQAFRVSLRVGYADTLEFDPISARMRAGSLPRSLLP